MAISPLIIVPIAISGALLFAWIVHLIYSSIKGKNNHNYSSKEPEVRSNYPPNQFLQKDSAQNQKSISDQKNKIDMKKIQNSEFSEEEQNQNELLKNKDKDVLLKKELLQNPNKSLNDINQIQQQPQI